eukprot:scpid5507/ scgid24698/ Sushi, von Willebrand factor type A, EGF and pentraxin domain-containing protein 1; CCP module-containing protein 22; Polydom; Selectin-like osteoblast-derived protein; Serologically defined breast cancer antigen NY-BR-38
MVVCDRRLLIGMKLLTRHFTMQGWATAVLLLVAMAKMAAANDTGGGFIPTPPPTTLPPTTPPPTTTAPATTSDTLGEAMDNSDTCITAQHFLAVANANWTSNNTFQNGVTDSFSKGVYILYWCVKGYDRVDGDLVRTCLGGGGENNESVVRNTSLLWSGSEPVCKDIDECVNGTHDCHDNATCTNTPGHWVCTCDSGTNGPGQVCYPDCPRALTVAHASTSVGPLQSVELNATLTNVSITCDMGYELNQTVAATTQCSAAGDWTPVPVCSRVNCGVPRDESGAHVTSLANGQINGTAHVFESVVRYSCNPGYVLQGDTSLTCLSSSAWSSVTPMCMADCGAYTYTPLHGGLVLLNDSSTLQDSLIEVRCDTGYTLSGESEARCGNNTQWQPDLNSSLCQIVDCNEPTVPQFAELQMPTAATTYNTTRRIRCMDGYTLVGMGETTCSALGAWMPDLNNSSRCDPVDCKAPVNPANGLTSLDRGTQTTLFSTATITCYTGYTLNGANLTQCETSAMWSPQPNATKCEPAICGALPSLSNGTIAGTQYTFGETLVFTCDSGFQLLGENSTVCQADGAWSSSVPTCEAVDCQDPGTPLNGTRLGDMFTFPSAVEYSCDFGLIVSGSGRATCLPDATWSSPVPVCELVDCGNPTSPANGLSSLSVASETTLFAEATIACTSGYVLRSGANITQCAHAGLWLPDPNATRCEPIDCGALPALSNGSISGTSFTFQKALTFACDSGFYLIGENTTICEADGTWSSSQPTCELVDCKDPGTPLNGSRTGDVFTYPATLVYSCDTGHNISGNGTLSCLSSTLWSSTIPTCKPVDCQDPGTPVNSTRSGSAFTYQSVLDYTCDTGYNLSGVARLTCLSSAQWSSSVPTCQIVSCGSIPAPAGSKFRFGVHGMTYLSNVSIACVDGYVLSGQRHATCPASGQWDVDFNNTRCNPVSCGVPPLLSNGSYAGPMSYTFGDQLMAVCDPGHVVAGLTNISCLSNKTWSSPSPACQPVNCSPLSAPANGSLIGSRFYYPNSVTFLCNLGYFLLASSGTEVLDCLEDGTWSAPVPVCTPIDCGPSPTAPPHGSMVSASTRSTVYNSTVLYACQPGYNLTSSDSTRCLLDGNWSSPAPVCDIVDCGQPHLPSQAKIANTSLGSDSTFNATIMYACESGYELAGPDAVTCLSSGLWSTPPSCKPVDCGPLSATANGVQFGNVTVYGSVVQVKCSNGYELMDSNMNSTVCLASALWSHPIPSCSIVQCPPLPVLANGHYPQGGRVFGSVRVSVCNQGYTDQFSSSSLLCLASGRWSRLAFCVRDCGPLVLNTTGVLVLSGGATTYGETLEFRCATGYYISAGDSERQCSADGMWNGIALECSPIVCTSTEVKNADVKVFDMGQVLEVQCNTGYLPREKQSHSCVSDGDPHSDSAHWHPAVTDCSIVKCSKLEIPPNVVITNNDTGIVFNSRYSFECASGYQFDGEPELIIRCLASGNWSGPALQCQEAVKETGDDFPLWVLAIIIPLFLLLLLIILLCLIRRREQRKKEQRAAAEEPKVGTVETFTRKPSVIERFRSRQSSSSSSSSALPSPGMEMDPVVTGGTAIGVELDKTEQAETSTAAAAVAVVVVPNPASTEGSDRNSMTVRELPEELEILSNPLHGPTLVIFSDNYETVLDEFRTIPLNMAPESDIPPGVLYKNRFRNVLPNAHTRVPLPLLYSEPHSDFINANFVRGYGQAPRKYIATQGPLMGTMGDFWRMVWKYDVSVIVMLTGLVENGKNKCSNYWPQEGGQTMVINDLLITCQSTDVLDVYTLTTLTIFHSKSNTTHEVKHYFFSSWADHGVPNKPDMLTFVRAVSPAMRWSKAPTVVHCSAGIGRTGAFITVDTAMQELLTSGTCDVLKIVATAREDRGGLVQNQGQYLFVYRVLGRFIKRMQGEVPEEDEASFSSEIDITVTAPNGTVFDSHAVRRMSTVQRALSASQANDQVAAAITMAASSELNLHQLDQQEKDKPAGNAEENVTPNNSDATDGAVPAVTHVADKFNNAVDQQALHANSLPAPRKNSNIDLANEHQVTRIKSTFESSRGGGPRDSSNLTYVNQTHEDVVLRAPPPKPHAAPPVAPRAPAPNPPKDANDVSLSAPAGTSTSDLNSASATLVSQIDKVLADLDSGLDDFTSDVALA